MTHSGNWCNTSGGSPSRARSGPCRSIDRAMGRVTLLVGALIVLTSQPTGATWSIVAADSETQEVVVASATCVANVDLKDYLPVIIVGKGGASAQAYADVNGSRRLTIWDGLVAGWTAAEIIDELNSTQPSMADFQHGVAEGVYGTSATQTGASNLAHASGVTGSFGSVHYAIQGGILTGSPVVAMAEIAFINTPGDLPAKTMAAMEAARSMGGDGRCSCSPTNPTSCGSPPPSFDKAAHIGFFIVSRYGDSDDSLCDRFGCADGDYFMDINIPNQNATHPDPVFQLQAQFDAARTDLLGRPDAIASTVSFNRIRGPSNDWLMLVELNDWQGASLGHGVPTLTVEHAPDSDQVTTIGTVVDLGTGGYQVTLTETGQEGIDVFLVTADDGFRPVVLPPRRVTLDLTPIFVDDFEAGDTSVWSAVNP